MTVETVPQYLSAPYQVLWLEVDDIGVMIFSYVTANTFGKFLELSLYGLTTWTMLLLPYFLYRYFKKRYPSGFLGHFFYFIGFKKMKFYPGYFIKFFFE